MRYCSACLEKVSTVELNGQETPCCQALVTGQLPEIIDHESLVTREEIIAYVSTMSPDSKKRRKTYDKKPKNTWPGKLTPDTASYKKLKQGTKNKSEKSAVGGKRQTKPLDITNKAHDQYRVIVTGLSKKPHTIYGDDRKDARRKARSYIRSMGTSITVASNITDTDNTTEIDFNG